MVALLLYGLPSRLTGEREYSVTVDKTTEGPHSRARETVHMVRLTIKHRAGRFKRIVVIEHGDLNIWIAWALMYGLSVEAESLGSSEVGRA